jgi:hypothetical protein
MVDQGSNGRLSFADAQRAARSLVEELSGRAPESVSGASRDEEGDWTVCVDVVELARIPPSTDVLATYEVVLDSDGELREMTRTRRYTRNQVSSED